MYNPEFLTEKNHLDDFKNPNMHVFGGTLKDTEEVEKLYNEHSVCTPCPVSGCPKEVFRVPLLAIAVTTLRLFL